MNSVFKRTAFGKELARRRLLLGKTVEEFCEDNDLDPEHIRAIERADVPPPHPCRPMHFLGTRDLCRALRIKEDERTDFIHLASIGRFVEAIPSWKQERKFDRKHRAKYEEKARLRV